MESCSSSRISPSILQHLRRNQEHEAAHNELAVAACRDPRNGWHHKGVGEPSALQRCSQGCVSWPQIPAEGLSWDRDPARWLCWVTGSGVTLQGELSTAGRPCDYLHIKRNRSRKREDEKWLWKCWSSILDRDYQYLRAMCLLKKVRNNGNGQHLIKRRKWKYSLIISPWNIQVTHIAARAKYE